jgi:hypothetical protein
LQITGNTDIALAHQVGVRLLSNPVNAVAHVLLL